jgi:hypothetical protein
MESILYKLLIFRSSTAKLPMPIQIGIHGIIYAHVLMLVIIGICILQQKNLKPHPKRTLCAQPPKLE